MIVSAAKECGLLLCAIVWYIAFLAVVVSWFGSWDVEIWRLVWTVNMQRQVLLVLYCVLLYNYYMYWHVNM